jgi:AraC-like DNA-binding protein
MSIMRQSTMTVGDERFLVVRTMLARCAPGLRTTSPTKGWHRLVAAATGIIVVRTPEGQWSAPTRNAVWVPAGMRAELETCAETSLRVYYIRASRAGWSHGGTPLGSRTITVEVGALDRRVDWHVVLVQLLLHEVRWGAIKPQELIWPRDVRAVRLAAIVQADPADDRRLNDLCRGQGVSARTVQRLFPLETGLTFENWRARFRFFHATRLLAERRKVNDVAASCGYRSPSAFVMAFTRFAGMTPGRFCRS